MRCVKPPGHGKDADAQGEINVEPKRLPRPEHSGAGRGAAWLGSYQAEARAKASRARIPNDDRKNGPDSGGQKAKSRPREEGYEHGFCSRGAEIGLNVHGMRAFGLLRRARFSVTTGYRILALFGHHLG